MEARSHRRAQKCKQRTITRARLHAEAVQKGGFRGRWLLVTTTYRDEADWHPGDLRNCLHAMREWARRNRVRLRYSWVLELTKRGRPHYHLMIFLPHHLHLPRFDNRGWWRQGSTRTEVARNAVGYLAKYASKGFGACDPETGMEYLYPRGARICGGTLLEGDQQREWRFWTAPRWARELVPPGSPLKRISGGYVVLDTGEVLESPWRFVGLSPDGKLLLFAMRQPGIEPCGA